MAENETSTFLGPTYTWNEAKIELHDVQPLFGGVRLLLPSYTLSQAWVTQVAQGGEERRYRVPLKWVKGEKEALCQQFIEQDFLTIESENRPGIPDEARPTITLTNKSGASHTVAKWAGVVDARFDALYAALLAIAERTEGLRPVPKRFHTWQKWLVGAGLVGVALLVLLAGWLLARWTTAVFLPNDVNNLLVCIGVLLVGVPVALFLLRRRERHHAPGYRLKDQLVLLLPIALLWFTALVSTLTLYWHRVAEPIYRRVTEDPAYSTIQDVQDAAMIGLTAVYTLYLVLGIYAWVGERLTVWLEERW